ncbi:MAG: hypothetical protein IKP40_11910 [Clostridia bacterium]|nr:hypothetical protein [Clostridia bacterium]
MPKDMRYYIERQGEALSHAIETAAETCAPFVRLWKEARPDRLYLVGSGTSGNAACAAAPGMAAWLGAEVTAVTPTSLPSQVQGKPLFVFISQGGQSTNTVRAIEKISGRWPSLALTGEEVCRINGLLPHVVLTCGHEEAGPKTMGYTCTILTLYLMALAVSPLPGAEKDAVLQALRGMAQDLPENIAAVDTWLSAGADAVSQAAYWAIAGTGTGREVAREAALKLQETLLRPAMGFEFEEYLHGPSMMLAENGAALGGMYLLPAKARADRPRVEALSELHAGFGSPVVVVGAGERASAEGNRLTLKAGEEAWLEPFWQILPSQCMGALLPERLGLAGKGHRVFQMIDKAVGVKCKN